MSLHGDPRGLEEVIRRLGLPTPGPESQDPEIECSDPNRVSDLLDLYEQPGEPDSIKDAAMWLVMGAYEEYHGTEPPSAEAWERISHILQTDRELHRDLIHYYGCPDDEDDDTFPVTRLMRQILPPSE